MCVKATVKGVETRARTGAERYFAELRKDPEYEAAYQTARRRIDQFDAIVRELDWRRSSLDLTEDEVARRADLLPEVVKGLFSAEDPDPTLSTLVAVADVLGMEIAASPLEHAQVS